MPNLSAYGITIIRVGMAGMLLWFGAQELLHPMNWEGYVPGIVMSFSGLSEHTIILANGAVEVACGTLLLLGVYARAVSFLMAVHIALIGVSLGYSAIAVRDLGLAAALFGLVFTGAGAWAVDKPVR